MFFKNDFIQRFESDDYLKKAYQAAAIPLAALLLTGDSGPEHSFVRPIL